MYGDSHCKINTFGHNRIDNKYSKAYIQLSSDGQPGEITFEMRYYGSQYNQNARFMCFSRVVSGKETTHFNHDIFDQAEVNDNHTILYFSNSLIIHAFASQSRYANLVRCVWFETLMKHWTEAFPR